MANCRASAGVSFGSAHSFLELVCSPCLVRRYRVLNSPFGRQNRIWLQGHLMRSKIDLVSPRAFVFEKEIRGGLTFGCVVFGSIHCNTPLVPGVQLAECLSLGTCPLAFSSRSFQLKYTVNLQFSFL